MWREILIIAATNVTIFEEGGKKATAVLGCFTPRTGMNEGLLLGVRA